MLNFEKVNKNECSTSTLNVTILLGRFSIFFTITIDRLYSIHAEVRKILLGLVYCGNKAGNQYIQIQRGLT